MSLLMFYHFAKVIKYWPAAVGKVKMSGHSNGIRYQYDDYVVGSLWSPKMGSTLSCVVRNNQFLFDGLFTSLLVDDRCSKFFA